VAPVEKDHTEGAFQFLDLLGNRRLADQKAAGAGLEASRIGYFREQSQMMQIHYYN